MSEHTVADLSHAMQTVPIADRVLIQLDEVKNTINPKLIALDVASSERQTGTVVSIGAGKLSKRGKRFPMLVSLGDHVVLKKYAGTEIMLNGINCLLVFHDEIEGVLEKDARAA